MAKMDEARFESCIGDTPEQIQMCMNCPYEDCIDCLGSGRGPYEEILESFKIIKELKKHITRLTKGELDVLHYYPYAKTDIDLAKMARKTQSMVCNTRKKLGLPVIKWTNQDIRKRLVALWLE